MKTQALALLLVGAGIAAPAITTPKPQQSDLVQTLADSGRFAVLSKLVTDAGLLPALQGPDDLTVFAPTDAAFRQLDPALVTFLTDPANVEVLRAVLTFHVAPGSLTALDVLSGPTVDTLNGQRIDVDASGPVIKLDGADLLKADIFATNGVIHVLQGVMVPVLDPIPVVAQQTGIFGTLLAAVDAAELGEFLSGEGPFTVFAPSDSAFAKLPPGLVNDLLLPQNKAKLVELLTYHVLDGRVFADQAVAAGTATTLQGDTVAITTKPSGDVFINDSGVALPDVDTSNGVVHVLDRVLIPAGFSLE